MTAYRNAFVLALALGLVSFSAAHAVVIRVKVAAPGPVHDGTSWDTAFLTIQEGLDLAQPGDEVWVSQGLYRECVTFRRARVSLIGGFAGNETVRPPEPNRETYINPANATAPNVTIPAAADGALVYGCNVVRWDVAPYPGVLCQARDVTIARSMIHYCGAPGTRGGGIVLETGSSAVISGNTISDNVAADGAGILATDATVTIADNFLENNRAAQAAGGSIDYAADARGGAILLSGGTAEIRQNQISRNSARNGGGICLSGGSARVFRNHIEYNGAMRQSAGQQRVICTGGGLLVAQSAVADIRDNVFRGNQVFAEAPLSSGDSAVAQGGGVAVLGAPGAVVAGNTFADNEATAVGGTDLYTPGASAVTGAGLYTDAGISVANNIFTGNTASLAWGAGAAGNPSLSLGPGSGTGQTSLVAANLFWRGDPASDDSAFVGWNGNIAADPLLDGFNRLGAGSPAIDRGDLAFVQPGETDLDGNPRVQGARVDIGATEFATPAALARLYVTPTGSDSLSGASWASAKRTIQAALNAVGPDGEVWAAAGTYAERITIPSRTALYGGFRGDETGAWQRVRGAYPSILDGGGRMPVVSILAGSRNITLDGFTVRNGRTYGWEQIWGAGILSHGGDVTLSHNLIEDNVIDYHEDTPTVMGGGLYADSGPITILNNTFRRNSASATNTFNLPQWYIGAWAYGGGAALRNCTAMVANNVFLDNDAHAGGVPGWFDALGTALYLDSVTGAVTGNTFARNGAGKIYRRDRTGFGGAVFFGAAPTPAFANNIVAFNGAGVSAEQGVGGIHHNDVFGNTSANWDGLSNPTGANGNIALDPLFVALASGDVHLRPASPCVDAGDSSALFGVEDMDGQPRLQGLAVDMGADELVPSQGVSMADVRAALQAAAGLRVLDAPAAARLDAAAGGGITMRDVVALARRLAAGQ